LSAKYVYFNKTNITYVANYTITRDSSEVKFNDFNSTDRSVPHFVASYSTDMSNPIPLDGSVIFNLSALSIAVVSSDMDNPDAPFPLAVETAIDGVPHKTQRIPPFSANSDILGPGNSTSIFQDEYNVGSSEINCLSIATADESMVYSGPNFLCYLLC